MSGTKDQFMDMQERICEDFAAGLVERDQAYGWLIRMGFDPHEAKDLLDNAER